MILNNKYMFYLIIIYFFITCESVKRDTDLKAVQIFSVDESDINKPNLIINKQAINDIFRNDKVYSQPLKVIVICGESRIGKSTFANLLYNNNNAIELDIQVNKLYIKLR